MHIKCMHFYTHSNSLLKIFKNLFPPQAAERGGENYDWLYQNLIRKYEDDLEHQVIYILHDS